MDVTSNRSQHQIKNGDIVLTYLGMLCHKLTDKPLLIRLDSGNDSIDNVAVLMDAGCFFIIKRNLRRESTDDWFEMAKQYCWNVSSFIVR